MSTAIPTPAPAVQVRWPLAWLLAILAAGLVLRVLHFKDEAFQLDEFTALAAVAERPGVEVGTTPTADDPLVPVGSLAEVSNRSVIPFGVRDPGPLYHAILWRVCQVLPVADWSLRLPSLLAGLACVAAVFFLIRRPFGDEMALVAALFVALDPIQVATSWLARPYALANLFVVLSFAALRGLLRTSEPRTAALLAVGYGACVAVIGYLNGLLLFVVAAHVGMVLYAVRGGAGGTARQAAGYWAGGLVFAAILLAPEFAYLYQVSAFALDHRDYLTAVNEIHLFTPLKALVEHNLVFLGGLALVLIAGAVVRMQLQGGGTGPASEGEQAPTTDGPADGPAGAAATAVTAAAPAATAAPTAAPPAPLPENDDALRMGRLWLFLPQVALLMASLLVAPIFATRFLTYTTLAAAIVLAYYATRDPSREARLGVALAVALALFLVSFWPEWSTGHALTSSAKARLIMGAPHEGGLAGAAMNEGQAWKDGDVVLMRSGLVESDFLRSEVPEATRPQVERVLVAPLTLLYPDSSHKPVIALTRSGYRNDKVKTPAGDKVALDRFYDDEFADRLKKYRRYWMTGVAPGDRPNSWHYLACVVPWMARHLDRGDLLVARERQGAEHYVVVKPDLGPDDAIPGLTEDVRSSDYSNVLHIVRPANGPK